MRSSGTPYCVRARVLSIGAMSGGQHAYYISLAREDYYTQGGEPPGRWFGQGARSLNLDGLVREDTLSNLFRGYSPDGSHSLVQRQKKAEAGIHRPGWDLTFSAPKSVSVFWSQSADATQQVVLECHRAAVDAALGFLEDEAVFTRRGAQGRASEKVGMVCAQFDHSTSRALDPQLHTHTLLLNISVREDGSTGALSAFQVFQCKMLAGALYRNELAHQLSQRLGLVLEQDRFAFRIEGVSHDLEREFSKRREAIETRLQEQGLSRAEAAATAAIQTREAKVDVSRERMFEDWRDQGRTAEWTLENAEALIGRAQAKEIDMDRILGRALDSILIDSAHFTRRDLMRRISEQSQALGVPARAVVEATNHYLSSSEALLSLGKLGGVDRYTTKEMVATEARLLDGATALNENRSHAIDGEKVESRLTGGQLTEEQAAAVRHVTTATGGISVVSGMAGTGKTRLLEVVRRAYEDEGFRVVGVCLAGRAARNLEAGSGIPSMTIAQLLWKLDPERQSEAIRFKAEQMSERFTPNILEPVQKLAERFGPDILEPLKRILDDYGPNIAAPLSGLAQRYAPNVMEVAEKLGPDIGQAWRALAAAAIEMIEKARQKAMLDPHTVLIVDEAGMVATPQMGALIDQCEAAGSKLVLVGDERQLKPIGPGAPFPELGARFGQARLEDIQRQESPWEREAIKAIAVGEGSKVLEEYDSRGKLSFADSKAEAMGKLIEAWSSGETHNALIIASTNRDVDELNRAAQRVRIERGELGESHVETGSMRFHPNDLLIFTSPSRTRGILNGSAAVVTQADAATGVLSVQLDSGRKLSFCVDDFPHITLGYAVTTHRAQGMTVDRALVLVGGSMQDRSITYVQASRARIETRFYAVKSENEDWLAELAGEVERNREKQMAHAVLREAQRMRP